jgi:hypothetical protein
MTLTTSNLAHHPLEHSLSIHDSVNRISLPLGFDLRLIPVQGLVRFSLIVDGFQGDRGGFGVINDDPTLLDRQRSKSRRHVCIGHTIRDKRRADRLR